MEELARMDGEIAAYGEAAQKHANGFWAMLILTAACWYFWGKWVSAFPGALAICAAVLSGYCTKKAYRIEKVRAFWKARLDAAESQ